MPSSLHAFVMIVCICDLQSNDAHNQIPNSISKVKEYLHTPYMHI